MNEVVKLFKGLADKSRLLILKSLMKEEMYVERLAQRLDVSPATVSFHLKKLEEIGAVRQRKEQYYTIYSLCPEVFSLRIMDLIACGDKNAEQDERDEAYRQKVLSSFIAYGKLKSIPVQQKKKNVILEEIVKSFSKDRTYTEKEVNLIICEYYDDFCTLRRELIDTGLMTRENNIYTKISETIK